MEVELEEVDGGARDPRPLALVGRGGGGGLGWCGVEWCGASQLSSTLASPSLLPSALLWLGALT